MRFDASTAAECLPLRHLAIALAILAILFVILGLLTKGTTPLNEYGYFYPKLRRVLAGQVPYRDFEFAYGPVLLYLPAALSALGLSVATGYVFALFLEFAAGTCALFGIVRWSNLPSQSKRLVFWIFGFFALVDLSRFGAQYSPFRFVLHTSFYCGLDALPAKPLPGVLFRRLSSSFYWSWESQSK